ncbi:Aste57867_14640 [Aphanomyces stellatus]|uniref:Aste57867_14640 protein n=1 Tax=Aphanomyces stellatus TaxID=120398 RepID=A0A485L1I8_9STRA|nr:hypothetical protein As57867_014585 [Aphanomyces stellatus]VFT91459.1 Aste57867_14640 [Aphanomyces stellatus]
MDEAEFSRLLAQFPVTRKKTYCRVAWKADAEAKPASSITELGEGANKRPRVDMSLNTAIETFMQEFFTPEESIRIRKEFEKEQAAFLNGLCLEDIEDMAAQFKSLAAAAAPPAAVEPAPVQRSTIPNVW